MHHTVEYITTVLCSYWWRQKYYISCQNDTSYERTFWFWCAAAVRPSSTPHVLPKQEPTRGSAQGPPTQRRVTTTASCRSRISPVVRASVGVSEVVRSTTAVDRRKTTWHRSGGRLASRPPKIIYLFFFLAPYTHFLSSLFFVCFFFPIDLSLLCVCVVIDTTWNIYVVVFLGWQAV